MLPLLSFQLGVNFYIKPPVLLSELLKSRLDTILGKIQTTAFKSAGDEDLT